MRMLLQRPEEDSRCLALSLPMIPLRQGLSLTLKASELLGSACLSPKPWDYRYMQILPALTWLLGIRMEALTLAQHSDPLNHHFLSCFTAFIVVF